MIRPHYADPHFPAICSDTSMARYCCPYCHDDDSPLPFAIYQDDEGLVKSAVQAPDLSLGFSCCTNVKAVEAAVMGLLALHVADRQASCPQCQLSEKLV